MGEVETGVALDVVDGVEGEGVDFDEQLVGAGGGGGKGGEVEGLAGGGQEEGFVCGHDGSNSLIENWILSRN